MIYIAQKGCYIASVDGKDLSITSHYIDGHEPGYTLKTRRGDWNLYKFTNSLDYSLDLIKLREVYRLVYRRKYGFSFWIKDKEYLPRVVNVTFKYSVKEYNRSTNFIYVKYGHYVADDELVDNVCIKNGELIAIRVGKQVENPLSKELLGDYFKYANGVYKEAKTIPTIKNVSQIREDLYVNGFDIDGMHFVRFKRSAGSSRVGKCLFIDERLYARMHAWEMAGINIKYGEEADIASLEPYIALTLSSIIDTMEIQKENILVVDDYDSKFRDKVCATFMEGDRLKTEIKEVDLSNSIWDGQSLMDKSLFGKYENKGMLLLRGRFFKSCCFNTNIQQWFEDNGITSVEQLNGFTLAKDIKDVKLITTPSSIKYLKFGTLEQFFKNMESTFGVVKYEKKTHYFQGRMVQIHYQLINTLQMSRDDVHDLLKDSIDYIHNIASDPIYLRHQVGYVYKEVDADFTKKIKTKNDIVYKFLSVNNEFAKTKIYSRFKIGLVRSMYKQLRCGHVLVNGNYSTLCGNPVEMLQQAIGTFNGQQYMDVGTVHTTRFDDGCEILGSRSPHVAIGNLLITRNKRYDKIDKYLNSTDEIIYVNSINENLLERLSGADFDSDTMLITDNQKLIKCGKKNYDNFPVPTKLVKAPNKKRKYTMEDLADLDIKTAVNKIGEIINHSQIINSILWNKVNNGTPIEDVMDIYCDVAQLDVMSNLEINKGFGAQRCA